MAKMTKEEWVNRQKERIGYDDLSDDEKKRADDCMDQAWDDVMGNKNDDSQDSEDSADNEDQNDGDTGDEGEPEGREGREIDHKDEDDEIDI